MGSHTGDAQAAAAMRDTRPHADPDCPTHSTTT